MKTHWFLSSCISVFLIINSSRYCGASSGYQYPRSSSRQILQALRTESQLNGYLGSSRGSPYSALTLLASKILEFIDEEVDPCDNFYKFACGNFLKSTIIGPYDTLIDFYKDSSTELMKDFWSIIEKESLPAEPKSFTMTRKFYQNCMSSTATVDESLYITLNNLKTLGSWPLLEGDSWQEEDFDWTQSVYKSRKLGYSINNFFTSEFTVSFFENSTKNIIIDQADLGLSDNPEKFRKTLVAMAVQFGANKTSAKNSFQEFLEFEQKLANISRSKHERFNYTSINNRMTLKDLQNTYTTIPWKEYFNMLLKPYAEVDEEEVIIVLNPTYFTEFEKLMENTPKKIQANYAMWRILKNTASSLENKGWQKCIEKTSTSMKESVHALYVRKHLKKLQESKQVAIELFKDIQQEFKKVLVGWQDKKTTAYALSKAESVTSKIAYPDELLDDKILKEFYEKLQITTGNFLQTELNVSLFRQEYSFREFRKPMSKSDWINFNSPTDVRTYYDPIGNQIRMTTGHLQRDSPNKNRPRYLNFGVTGTYIGHEIAHSFGTNNMNFDEEGNLVDWWDSETQKKISEKAECLIHQYGNYTVEEVGLKVNGTRTLKENIADNVGMKAAYLAYQTSVEKYGSEPGLPGLNYSPSQLFWIVAAQKRCIKRTVQSETDRVMNGVHSPKEFRVLGPFSNRPEFAKDFNCPKGSGMNPEKKCSVW